MVLFLCFTALFLFFLDRPYAYTLNLDNGVSCLTDASKATERALYEICMNACLEDGELWVAGFDDEIHAVSFWIRPGADFQIG
jgi:hypothetical protein